MTNTSTALPEKHCRKEYILTLLTSCDGWISGEEISAQLGITRAAVAKYIAALREDGHAITAATRRGYRMEVLAVPLTQEAVSTHLTTKKLGRQSWRILKNTTSTSNECVAWAYDGGEGGSVVLAEHQTQGRGRKGKNWFTSPRGLQFSLLLRPQKNILDMDALTLDVAEAVAQAINNVTNLSATVKIPNDVLVHGKKVCGVLAELGMRASEVDWLVLGIGCNVNALAEELSPPASGNSTSLFIESGNVTDRACLLACILNHLEKKLGSL